MLIGKLSREVGKLAPLVCGCMGNLSLLPGSYLIGILDAPFAITFTCSLLPLLVTFFADEDVSQVVSSTDRAEFLHHGVRSDTKKREVCTSEVDPACVMRRQKKIDGNSPQRKIELGERRAFP